MSKRITVSSVEIKGHVGTMLKELLVALEGQRVGFNGIWYGNFGVTLVASNKHFTKIIPHSLTLDELTSFGGDVRFTNGNICNKHYEKKQSNITWEELDKTIEYYIKKQNWENAMCIAMKHWWNGNGQETIIMELTKEGLISSFGR